MQSSEVLLAAILFIFLQYSLMTSGLTSHAGICAFHGDNGVYASDQENSSYERKVAAVNEKLGNGEKNEENQELCCCCCIITEGETLCCLLPLPATHAIE